MSDTIRIDVEEARRRIESGQALLVCAYDDAVKCATVRLDGSISLDELESRLPDIPTSQEIIFYCA